MLRKNALPPSSGQLNLVSVVSGMTERRECVHYVAVLGTIEQGHLSRFSDSLRAGPFEDRIRAAARYSAPAQEALRPIQLRTQGTPGNSQG